MIKTMAYRIARIAMMLYLFGFMAYGLGGYPKIICIVFLSAIFVSELVEFCGELERWENEQ